ncbi:CUB and peptidase domain-containing protein 1, partial [Acropora cervicornis]
ELIVYFKYFELEYSWNCRYTKLQLVCSELFLHESFHSAAYYCLPLLLWDYLRISDDRNNTIGTYCGDQTGQRVRVVATVAVLTFRSDSSVQDRGFELFFSFSPRGNATLFSFTTPTPTTFQRPTELIVYFKYFELEYSWNCSWDYLRISDDRNHTIGTYCGDQTGERVPVVATVAVLTFRSDSSVQY